MSGNTIDEAQFESGSLAKEAIAIHEPAVVDAVALLESVASNSLEESTEIQPEVVSTPAEEAEAMFTDQVDDETDPQVDDAEFDDIDETELFAGGPGADGMAYEIPTPPVRVEEPTILEEVEEATPPVKVIESTVLTKTEALTRTEAPIIISPTVGAIEAPAEIAVAEPEPEPIDPAIQARINVQIAMDEIERQQEIERIQQETKREAA